jgi:hypothetical protein
MTVGEFLGVRLSPRSPGAWVPPAGEAGIEFVNGPPGVRKVAVACSHGCLAGGPFDEWKRTLNLFGSVHPQCPVRWVHKLWFPAAAGGVAARRVTGTPDDAAQAALARVRSQGQEVEKFLALNRCVECVPGLSEVSRLKGPDSAAFALVHAANCPRRRDGI